MKTPQQLANELFQSLAFSTMALSGNRDYAVNKARRITRLTFSEEMVNTAEKDMNAKIDQWAIVALVETASKVA